MVPWLPASLLCLIRALGLRHQATRALGHSASVLSASEPDIFPAVWQLSQRQSGGWFKILVMLLLMEDAMNTENIDNTLYVLVVSLLGTALSFSAVWYVASSGFVA